MQALHFVKEPSLLSDPINIVDGLVKDRNLELFCGFGETDAALFRLVLLLFREDVQSLGHNGLSDLSKLLPQAFLCRSTRDYGV